MFVVSMMGMDGTQRFTTESDSAAVIQRPLLGIPPPPMLSPADHSNGLVLIVYAIQLSNQVNARTQRPVLKLPKPGSFF